MESNMFDSVKFEKNKAVARFNRFRRIVKLWQIFEVLVLFGLISWSSIRVPVILRILSGYIVEISAYLLNHHVVFLIGNVIIVLLFMLCRQNDVVSGDGDFYDDYVKHSEAIHQRDSTLQPPFPEMVVESENLEAESGGGGGGDEEKQIVVVMEDTKVIPQCDDVAVAIENASRQIKRFERTQSEKLKRDISVRPQPKLRRSDTENSRRKVCSNERRETAEIETLSNEEFRRTVDAFIDKHWSKRRISIN